MTSKDLMPFGKHKGKPMGEVPRDYLEWLLRQEGFTDKNKEMTRWIREGDASAPAVEQSNNAEESTLFARAPEAFKHWWSVAYGDRARKEAPQHYIPFMRVALEAWLHATGIQLAAQKPQPSVASVVQPSKADTLRAALPPTKPAKTEDYLTNDVPF